MDGLSLSEYLSNLLGDWLQLAIYTGTYAGLLGVVVLAINVLFRRWLSAGQMGLLWALVLLRLIVPIFPGSALSLESLVWSSEQDVVGPVPAAQMAHPVVAEAPDAVNDLTALNLPAVRQEPATDGVDVMFSMVPLIWFVGGMAGLLWTVVHYTRFCRRVGRTPGCADVRILSLWKQCCELAGVRHVGRIVQFDGVEQPAIMGVVRTTLLLPHDVVELNDEQLRMIMLHELAHVRRWDIVANWALVVIRSIHWWNPVYWLASARFRSLREQACDAFVIQRIENQPTHNYGELLLSLAARRPSGSMWRVNLPASILTFFPSAFRRRAVRVRLKSLRRAGIKRGWWQVASVAALATSLVVSGFTSANEPEVKPVDLPTWMASHPDAVLGPKRSYEVQERFTGPRETRQYDIKECIDQLEKETASRDEAVRMLEATLKSSFDHSGQVDAEKDGVDDAKESRVFMCRVEGTRLLDVAAPAEVHERLRHMLDAISEGGLAQIAVETRFLSADRDLVSELGISWQFLEAFSSERESAFPRVGRDGSPVVRAEARVDEYLPLVVSTLSKE